jgi:hypothetical protein
MIAHRAGAAALVLGIGCLSIPATAAEPTLLEQKTLLGWPGGDGTQNGPPGLDDPQLDVRAGAGLNGAADNFFAGAGFVLRAPWDCDLRRSR